MSFIKFSSSVIAKSFLLVFLLSSGFFLSGSEAEASSSTWSHVGTTSWYNTYDVATDTLTYHPPMTAVMATFYAATNKNVYTVGETASVTVAAAAGDGGNAFNIWWDPAMNAVINFFFGNSAPYVGVVAYFGAYQVAQCDAAGSCSATQSIAVNVTPGTYNLSLTGCYNGGGPADCTPSSLPFTVVCPGGTSWNGSSCAVPAPVPVNGACGNTSIASGINTCSAGTLGENHPQPGGVYDWYCMGINGGSPSSLCRYTPPAFCGDNVCNGGETCGSCSSDCGVCSGPVAPTINSFTGTYGAQVNQTTLNLPTGGGTVTLKWSTTNATSCFAYNDWTGWKVVNNSIGESVSSTLSKTYTYTLECWNSTGVSTGQRSVTVNVAGASVPVCTGPIPPNTSVHPGDSTGLGADTNYSYSATDTTPPKCQYFCNSTYTWNGSGCVTVASCTRNCNRDNQVCSGQPYNDANNCAPNNCTGTRLCDYNWKEVAP